MSFEHCITNVWKFNTNRGEFNSPRHLRKCNVDKSIPKQLHTTASHTRANATAIIANGRTIITANITAHIPTNAATFVTANIITIIAAYNTAIIATNVEPFVSTNNSANIPAVIAADIKALK